MRLTLFAGLALSAASATFAADPDAVVLSAGDITVTYQDVERYADTKHLAEGLLAREELVGSDVGRAG